jgi:hypothetical protein
VFVEQLAARPELFFVERDRGDATAPAPLGPELRRDQNMRPPYPLSADLRFLTYRVDEDVYVVDVSSPSFPEPRQVVRDGTYSIVAGEGFAGSSSRILTRASGGESFDLLVADAEDAEPAFTRVNAPVEPGGTVGGFSGSPGGERVAYSRVEGTGVAARLLVHDLGDLAATPLELHTAANDEGFHPQWWSDDGTLLGYLHDVDADGIRELFVTDTSVVDPTPDTFDPGAEGQSVQPAFSSQAFAFLTKEPGTLAGTLTVVPLRDGGLAPPIVVDVPTPDTVQAASLEWSASGTRLLFRTLEPEATRSWLFDLEAAQQAPQLLGDEPVPGGEVSYHVFSPDGQRVFYTANIVDPDQYELYMVELGLSPSTPVELSEPRQTVFVYEEVVLSPDGEHLLFTGIDHDDGIGLFHVDLSGADPAAPVRLDHAPPGGRTGFGPRFSPEHTSVFFVLRSEFGAPYHLFVAALDAPGAVTQLSENDAAGVLPFPLPR